MKERQQCDHATLVATSGAQDKNVDNDHAVLVATSDDKGEIANHIHPIAANTIIIDRNIPATVQRNVAGTNLYSLK